MTIARFSHRLRSLAACILVASGSSAAARAEPGAVAATIVSPEPATAVDQFAVQELASAIEAATGVPCRTVSAADAAGGTRRIFVGLSPPALEVLGPDPLQGLAEQTFRIRPVGEDLCLYGTGLHGNLYAVYDYLERDLGWRSFSAFEKPTVPPRARLSPPAGERAGTYAFTYRYTSHNCYLLRPDAFLFLYRNRINLGFHVDPATPAIQDFVPDLQPRCHTLFVYVPPQETPRHGINPPLEWLPNKHYFRTKPEYFSQDAAGARTDRMQLCFSNAELRRTLTANVEEHVRRSGGRGVITVDANDVPGRFCFCDGCTKLEATYGCLGGPLIDYLLELSAGLRERHPAALVKFLAYRKEQSQRPPRLDRLPDNLVVVFAPIDDNFAADWNHPSNAETYRDLRDWCRIARNVWVWYYPNTYTAEIPPPFGNLDRLTTDIRLLREAGCNGTYFEHDVGVTLGLGFSELQAYVQTRLFQDPGQDPEPLIREFTEHAYGEAAPLFRRYLAELEDLRRAMTYPLPWDAKPPMFRELTPENLRRWERTFDEMEALVGDSPRQLFQLRLVRASLDMSVLRHWREMHRLFPEDFPSPEKIEERIRVVIRQAVAERVAPTLAWAGQRRQAAIDKELEAVMLQARATLKPVPAPLDQIAAARISQGFPPGATVKDPDAALGVAKTWEGIELPLTTGLYDRVARRWLFPRSIRAEEIVPDRYHLYGLGRITLTTDCLIWVGQAWGITVPLEQFALLGAPDTEWEAYLSLKFEGPGYSPASRSPVDRVSCDRVILVRADDGASTAD